MTKGDRDGRTVEEVGHGVFHRRIEPRKTIADYRLSASNYSVFCLSLADKIHLDATFRGALSGRHTAKHCSRLNAERPAWSAQPTRRWRGHVDNMFRAGGTSMDVAHWLRTLGLEI